MYKYYKALFEGCTLPFAFVDLDLFEQNGRDILARAGSKKIRIASKSVRCVDLLRRILDFSPQYQGLMCYTATEAVFLAAEGFDDLLVAYPTVQPSDIKTVITEVAKGKKIYLMTDSVAHLEILQTAAAAANIVLPICVDIDLSMPFLGVHFGVHRSSLKTEANMRAYLSALKNCPNLRLAGLMGYEAQIAGLGDRQRGKWLMSRIIGALQKRSIKRLRLHRARLLAIIAENNIVLDFVNGGGTGSLESSREEAGLTELAVGSGFFSPTLFDQYSRFRHQPAAGFAIQICRQPQENIYTCLGGGYVASGAAGADKVPMPYLPEGCQLDINEQAGEVQTPIIYKGKEKLTLGAPIFMRHAKAGELCERFDNLYLVSKGKILATVPTYRGQGQCFL